MKMRTKKAQARADRKAGKTVKPKVSKYAKKRQDALKPLEE